MSNVFVSTQSLVRIVGRTAACLTVLLLVCSTVAQSAHAQTMTVTRSDDRNNPTCAAGDCSLREALNAANAAPDVATIQFAAVFDTPQVIGLTNGHLTISTSVSIIGKGANLTTVSANGAPRAFYIGGSNANITISGLTIADGDTGNQPNGGGIENQGDGTVNLIDCAFTNNRSTVYGSAIYRGTGGTWNIVGCTFSGNNAFQGAIYISGGTTNITNTTISGNNARSPFGGGILNSYGTLNIASSTITGNTAGSVAGVITGGPTTVKNTIIAGNSGTADIDGSLNNSIISGGYNFIGKSDGTDGFTNGVNNDQVGTSASPKDPLLEPLADNGGRTLTHALSTGSPALDKGFSFGSTTDQRGFTRPVDLSAYPNAPGGDGADIGAAEEPAPVTFTVTRTDDRNTAACAVGDCSLREAITASNASFSLNLIQFSALFDSPQTVVLANGELTISKSLSIVGKGANLTTISGNNASRVFLIPGSLVNVTLSGLTIANGNGTGEGSGNGGGLKNLSTGIVNLTNCAFTNNAANTGYGGGLEYRSPGGGSLNIAGCTFSGNVAVEGGAIKIESNAVNVTNTTISGNTGSDFGGGIANYNGVLTLTSSTITGNTTGAAGSGGGLVNIPSGVGMATIGNSLIAGNNGGHPDVGGGLTSAGYNVIGKSDGSSGFTDGVNNDQAGTIASPIDPLLLPLANNGGTTMTHALLAGSPAIDKGSATGPATDQRGSTRPIDQAGYSNAAGGNGSDIGAFEAQTALPPVPDLAVTKTHTGGFVQGDSGKTYTIGVSNGGGAPTSGNISVVDTLPAGLTATAIAGPGWTCTLGNVSCTRSDVLPAFSSYPAITLTVGVAANAPASVTNVATVSGGGEVNTRNNQASDPTTVATSDLTVTKTHTGSFTQGDSGKTYAITVSNSGLAATSASVSVVDTLPAGLTATAIGGTGWTCTLGTLSCTRSDVLAAAASYPPITLTVDVSVVAPASVTNEVAVSGGGESNSGNNQGSDPTTIVALALTVTRIDDRNNPACGVGDCSLREAVSTANASADIKAIQFSALFDAPQTITLTNGQIAINKSMSIVGKGASLTTVSGADASRIFLIAQNPSNVTISGLTMANGSGGDGAGLRNLSTGVVNLTDCAFLNNIAVSAYGGAIEDRSPGGGSLNITGCTFSGNTAAEGGAIKIESNVVNVANTTISGNTADFVGGGIANYSGSLTLTSSTITGNTADGGGAGGGLANMSAGATATVGNSIVAGNTGVDPDVSGSFTSIGYNLIGKSDGSSGFADGVNGDQAGTIASPKDPLVLPLDDYGGTTWTHALSSGSPAIDKGFGFGSTTDQRSLLRPLDDPAIANAPGGDGSDIGAFEAQLTVVTTSNINPSALGQTVMFTAKVLAPGAAPTGTVDFFDGATPLCPAVGLIAGQATCVTDNLPTGLSSITAAYSGDANYGAATSLPYVQSVSHTPIFGNGFEG